MDQGRSARAGRIRRGSPFLGGSPPPPRRRTHQCRRLYAPVGPPEHRDHRSVSTLSPESREQGRRRAEFAPAGALGVQPRGANLEQSLRRPSRRIRRPVGDLRRLACGRPSADHRSTPAAPLGATGEVGTPDRIRTCDLLLRRQTLYPAELRALRDAVVCSLGPRLSKPLSIPGRAVGPPLERGLGVPSLGSSSRAP